MDNKIWDEKKQIETVNTIVNTSDTILKLIQSGNLTPEKLNEIANLGHGCVLQLATLVKETVDFANEMRDLFYRLKHSHDTAKNILEDRIRDN